MAMLKRLVAGDRMLTIGDEYKINVVGKKAGLGKLDQVVRIQAFKKSTYGVHIGLYCINKNEGWTDLDGLVTFGHGHWVAVFTFNTCFIPLNLKYKIKTQFIFKKQNLETMPCKILYRYKDGTVFVELDKDVGGSSCDGLGETGHCIILASNNLEKIN